MYVKTGQVRFGYMHFVFLGDESGWAAEASECADEQGKFWEYHDLLFVRHGGENQGAFNKANLKKFAADLKLNTTAFNTCLDSGKYTSVVAAETLSLQSLGVQSTPTFLVNDRPVSGALPFEMFQQFIEAEKAKRK